MGLLWLLLLRRRRLPLELLCYQQLLQLLLV